jgi:SAM-dependent methyltransferase
MSLQVLQSMEEVEKSRARLGSLGWGYQNSPVRRLLSKLTRGRFPFVGDHIKSWDVLKTAEFAVEHLKKDQPVLDLGAFGSEMPLVLRAAGFSRVSGIDLNRWLGLMPRAGSIRYVRGNFHACPFPAATFDMVTAISVIEHGYDPDKLLSEASRLLRPGGYFVASFDYWPEKIPTDGFKIFGMDWLIFSEKDVQSLIAKAAGYGLTPAGPLAAAGRDRPVRYGDFTYTFGWLALRKK